MNSIDHQHSAALIVRSCCCSQICHMCPSGGDSWHTSEQFQAKSLLRSLDESCSFTNKTKATIPCVYYHKYKSFHCFNCRTYCDVVDSMTANTPVNPSHPGKMAASSQTTFSNAFSWMKMYEFRFKFHWSLFLRVQSTICKHWFR